MANLHWNLEWLNHNRQRRYPLADTALPVDTSGVFRLPDDFLVEVDLPLPSSLTLSPQRLFIDQLSAFAGGYSLRFAYQPPTGPSVPLAQALVPEPVPMYQSVAIVGIAPYEDIIGKLTVGVLDSINQQPAGFWQFQYPATALDPDCVRLQLRSISALRVVSAGGSSMRLTGEVELVAGRNCQLVPVSTSTGIGVQIHFIQGAGTVEDCACVDDAQAQPILRINGIAPTASGDFTLLGSSCVEVQAVENGLRLVNRCAQPCCGCPELERITQDLQRLAQQNATVQDFVLRLQRSVDTTNQIVLGARLGDQRCSGG